MEIPKRLKISVIGDGDVGKTCLLYTYTKGEFPVKYVPTIFENHMCRITLDNMAIETMLCDTVGPDDLDRLRILSYRYTACFVICYSVGCRSSFENVTLKWYPEIKTNRASIPIVLVATQIDLRDSGEGVVTREEGEKLKKTIRATALVECSALKQINLDMVFEEAVRAVLYKKRISKKMCNYL